MVFPKFFFCGAPQFWTLTYQAPPSSHHLAKFRGDRRTGLKYLPLKHLHPQHCFGGGLPNLGLTMSKCPDFQSCVKVSRRSAEASRRYSAAKCGKQTNKPQHNVGLSPPGTTVPGGLKCTNHDTVCVCVWCRYLLSSSYVERLMTDSGPIYRNTDNIVRPNDQYSTLSTHLTVTTSDEYFHR